MQKGKNINIFGLKWVNCWRAQSLAANLKYSMEKSRFTQAKLKSLLRFFFLSKICIEFWIVQLCPIFFSSRKPKPKIGARFLVWDKNTVDTERELMSLMCWLNSVLNDFKLSHNHFAYYGCHSAHGYLFRRLATIWLTILMPSKKKSNSTAYA